MAIDFEQVKRINSHFSDFRKAKKINSRFADFGCMAASWMASFRMAASNL